MQGASKVVVVGSVNEDHVLTVDALPAPGETVIASGGTTSPGGKGANQAAAAALYGVPTVLVGVLGDDEPGRRLEAQLRTRAVDTSRLRRVAGPSGSAVVLVDTRGDNCIVVEPGANATLASGDVRDSLAGLRPQDVLLVQCETPASAVGTAMDMARTAGATAVLNWSPVVPLPDEVVARSTVLVVNRGEAEQLLNVVPGAGSGRELATRLADRHGVAVVVTLGAAGVAAYADGRTIAVDARAPESAVVDSTGAGDCFAGTLAAALASGAALETALGHACDAATDSVTTLGAQPRVSSAAPSAQAVIEPIPLPQAH